MKESILKRLDAAEFLFSQNRTETAFLVLMTSIASLSRIQNPDMRDGDAFRTTVKGFRLPIQKVEYRGNLVGLEQILYKWIRCNLIHENELPVDITLDNSSEGMFFRAGGAPDYHLKLGAGWFDFLIRSARRALEAISDD